MYSSTLSLTSALDRGGWSTPRPASFTPGKETQHQLYKRLGGPRGRSGLVRKIRLPRGFDPRNVQPVASRYTDRAIPAQDSIFSQSNSVHSLLPYAFKFHRTVDPLIPLLFLNKSLKLIVFPWPLCVLYFSPILSPLILLPCSYLGKSKQFLHRNKY